MKSTGKNKKDRRLDQAWTKYLYSRLHNFVNSETQFFCARDHVSIPTAKQSR